MSEEKQIYASEIEDSTNNALAMLGTGYDDTLKAAIIERPRSAHGIGDAGLEEYKLSGWVKMSAKFRTHIKKLRGAKLTIWLCLALSIDENGECKLKIKELQEMTGYSHTEIIDSLRELSEMGFLSIDKSHKTNLYQPVFVAKGTGKNPRVKKLDSTPAYPVESSPSLEKIPPTSSKKVLKELKKAEKPPTPPEVILYREVTGRYPKSIVYGEVISAIQKVSVRLGRICEASDLAPFFRLWMTKSNNEYNMSIWLLEWAVSGKSQSGYQKPPTNFDNNMSILQAFAEKG